MKLRIFSQSGRVGLTTYESSRKTKPLTFVVVIINNNEIG